MGMSGLSAMSGMSGVAGGAASGPDPARLIIDVEDNGAGKSVFVTGAPHGLLGGEAITFGEFAASNYPSGDDTIGSVTAANKFRCNSRTDFIDSDTGSYTVVG